MDIGRSFSMPFKDPEWVKKVGLGGLWVLLGVTAPTAFGAQLDYIRSVAHGNETLPDWDDFGGKWVKGFLAYLGVALYMLPAIILWSISFVPLLLAGATGNEAAAAGGMAGLCLFGSLAFVWMIAVSVLAYGGIVNYAINGSFGAMFAFGDIMQRIRSGSGYFVAWGMSLAISTGLSVASSILGSIVIGAILVPWLMFGSLLILAHLLGQYAARAYGLPGLPAMAVAPTPAYAPPAAGGYQPPAPPAVPPAAPVAAPAAPPAPPAAPPVAPAAPPAPTVVPPAAPVAAPAAPPAPPAAPPVAPAAPPAPTVAPPAPPAAPPAPPAAPHEVPPAPPAPPAPPSEPSDS